MHAYPIIDIVTLCGSEARGSTASINYALVTSMFPRPQNVYARAFTFAPK
jgi:hypothetical protein